MSARKFTGAGRPIRTGKVRLVLMAHYGCATMDHGLFACERRRTGREDLRVEGGSGSVPLMKRACRPFWLRERCVDYTKSIHSQADTLIVCAGMIDGGAHVMRVSDMGADDEMGRGNRLSLRLPDRRNNGKICARFCSPPAFPPPPR